MSLRDALRIAVARCTPLAAQPATFAKDCATADATVVQPTPPSPQERNDPDATAAATGMQQLAATRATHTFSAEHEKLRVSHHRECHPQPGAQMTHRLTAELLAAAMKGCDQHRDGEAARNQMRGECLATSPNLQADLLAHFRQSYPTLHPAKREK